MTGEKRVHFIATDDWVRMYVNGAMVAEGHSLGAEQVADLLVGPENVTHEYIALGEPDYSDDDAPGPEAAYEDRCAEYEAEQRGTGGTA